MSAWAKPGVKCVCIDGEPRHGSLYSAIPIKDAIYTVASVEYCVWDYSEGLGVHLAEIRRPPAGRDGRIYPFNINRFRPLITQEDDVRLIKSLLPEDAGLIPAGVEVE